MVAENPNPPEANPPHDESSFGPDPVHIQDALGRIYDELATKAARGDKETNHGIDRIPGQVEPASQATTANMSEEGQRLSEERHLLQIKLDRLRQEHQRRFPVREDGIPGQTDPSLDNEIASITHAIAAIDESISGLQ